jgi:MFS family permease
LIAWPISSTLSSKIIIRFGYRFTAVIGASFATVGVGMVTLFHMDTGLPYIVFSMLMIGTGLGFMSTAFIIAVQNAVPWNLRGVATASTQFVRTMGGTIGVAVMGTILNAQLALHFIPIFAHYSGVLARLPKGLAPSNVLLTPDVRSTLPIDVLRQLQTALAQSLFWVYALIFVCALIGLAFMFLLPGGKAEQYSYKVDTLETAQSASAKYEPEITTIG